MSRGVKTTGRSSRDDEIREGLEEYLISPRSGEGHHVELAESFEARMATKPLTREQVEKEIEDFIGKNLRDVLPILLSAKKSPSELIDALGLTNEDIGLLGANYYIRDQNGRPTLLIADDEYPQGRELSFNEGFNLEIDLLALAYTKANVRVDSRREIGKTSGPTSHRYFFRSQERYLCANDFGMRVWNEDERRMEEGDVQNLMPFIQTVRQQVERISENFRTIYMPIFDNNKIELGEEARQALGVPYLEYTQIGVVENEAHKQSIDQLSEFLAANKRDRELLLAAIPARKVRDHLHFHFDRIARKYGFVGDDPEADYQAFKQKSDRLNRLFRDPTEQERANTTLEFVYSDFYRKPVITGGHFDRERIISQARLGVKEVLARRAVDSDPETREVFTRASCKRGRGSPFYYWDGQIYDFILEAGAEKAQQVLEQDDRNIHQQMVGLEYLQAMRYDISKMDPDQLKKQLHLAYTLERSGLWRYLRERNNDRLDQAYRKDEDQAEGKHWLEMMDVRDAKNLFYEGKRMYWLAKQVWMNTSHRGEDDRFYFVDRETSWDRYDVSKVDVSEEKLRKYLEEKKELIIALMGIGQDQRSSGEQAGKPATLGLIIQALDQGRDIRGVALAHDKQRYLEGVIKGNVKNDLEFAIEDWPPEWRKALSIEEIALYYEYAADYVRLDPNGLTKYAAWVCTVEGRKWTELLKETPRKKADLDFRICLSMQTEGVRESYREAAEYVDNRTMQAYLLRFNSTRGADGRIANWHDVLLWTPNIRKLEVGDAKSLLMSIETMDENREFLGLLQRYSKDRDPFKTSGSIQSLKELRKRVAAIESAIDLTKFPAELLDITSAPGFDLVALESMRGRADFQDLFEGKLDRDQPFQPYARLFTGRPLTESLREGLGSQRQKITGTASDPKALYRKLNNLIGGREKEGRKMEVSDLLNFVPQDLEQEVIKLLLEHKVDVGPIVEAQIHAKSDPEGWVCGNYVDCCMPFGSRYNNDYMFNPSTQYFTIKYNGRIIAQSVVVDARNYETGEGAIILDNIEVAPNYMHLSPLLSTVYQSFWSEYTSLDVMIGTGYSDMIPSRASLRPNVYEPKNRLLYSDARGARIYDLPKLYGVEPLGEIISFSNLTERDAALIAQMEREIYPEAMLQGKSHFEEIFRTQRELEVPGAASSFMIRQGREAAGYLCVLPEESRVNKGERVAHLYDMAVLPKFRGSPVIRRMMERVLDMASAYGVPIEAEARASTSYALLMNPWVRRWFERRGFNLTHNERMPKYLGGEDFYYVRFENIRNEAETS